MVLIFLILGGGFALVAVALAPENLFVGGEIVATSTPIKEYKVYGVINRDATGEPKIYYNKEKTIYSERIEDVGVIRIK